MSPRTPADDAIRLVTDVVLATATFRVAAADEQLAEVIRPEAEWSAELLRHRAARP